MALVETLDLTQRIRVYEATFDAASVAVNTAVEQDITVTGVAADDHLVGFEPPDLAVALAVCGARVKAANTIAVRFVNPTAGALDPGSLTYKFYVASASA